MGSGLPEIPGSRETAEQRVFLPQELTGPRGAWEKLSMQGPLDQDSKKNTDTRDMIHAGRKSSWDCRVVMCVLGNGRHFLALLMGKRLE